MTLMKIMTIEEGRELRTALAKIGVDRVAPLPIPYFDHVLAMARDVVPVLGQFIAHELFQVRGGRL
jgi:hypothetical protein